jgi:hypothetical protein
MSHRRNHRQKSLRRWNRLRRHSILHLPNHRLHLNRHRRLIRRRRNLSRRFRQTRRCLPNRHFHRSLPNRHFHRSLSMRRCPTRRFAIRLRPTGRAIHRCPNQRRLILRRSNPSPMSRPRRRSSPSTRCIPSSRCSLSTSPYTTLFVTILCLANHGSGSAARGCRVRVAFGRCRNERNRLRNCDCRVNAKRRAAVNWPVVFPNGEKIDRLVNSRASAARLFFL